MLIHKEDTKKKGYYLCIHAVGKGNPKKITKDWSKVTCKNCLKRNVYHFGIKENKELGFKSVVLADDTHIVLHKHKVGIGYPKKKFNKIFRQQIKDRKKSYLWVEFSEKELKAIMKGIDMLSRRSLSKKNTKEARRSSHT